MQMTKSKPRPMLLAPMLLAVTGCAGYPVISASSSPCSSLVPGEWKQGVAHAPPPAEAADPLRQLKAWIAFGTTEAGQLEKANGRTADAMGIVERCEARDREAVKASRPKVLGLF